MKEYAILIVDDDADILTTIRGNLKLDGYTVHTAPSGQKALKYFQTMEYRIDLVVLDLMLPDIDGIQVCRAIRTRSAVPIIMLTAKDSISDKVLGLESGADDYIVKPFDYLELAARIKARLRNPKQAAALNGSANPAGISFRPDSLTVAIDKREVVLTRKEFEILQLLVQNAGHGLHRKQIRDDVWPDSNLYSWSRTIDVHIRNLRMKLEKNPQEPDLIKTVPSVGYLYQPPEPS
jgi:DNA-binding response OmpR family regulator